MTAISPEDADSVALVTVILPAYNHAKYVVEAMDSVRAQTFTRWELIVIDDGSTDDTWAVLQAYAAQHGDPRIRLLTQANAGSHATLNRGLAMARTPYLAILNSDDRYAPERLQRLVDTAQAAADEVFIVTGLRLIDGDGNFFPESYWWNAMYGDILQRWRAAQSSGVNPALQTLLWGNFTVSTSNFFMSRTLWQRLQTLQDQSDKIKVTRRETAGHIVHATNDALALAQGEFVVFLDHDDVLAPQALLRLAQAINAPSAPDFIYSDEDKLDEQGRRCLPLFKPQWSPTLQWAQNYVGHIMCVRRAWLERLGGLLEGSQGSQDHDLVLRLAAQGAKIEHIPEVLYHWRIHAASTSASPQSKPYAHLAGRQAVARHLASRYGEQFDRVDDGDHAFVYQPRFRVPAGTVASIIIPTRDKADLLDACIQSIHRHTTGIAYEILVLDNGSTEPETQACFQRLTQDARVRVIAADIPFNWSRLNNIGRSHARGQVLVFLNNDTEIITPDWLVRLVEYALLPDVATVGALLLYPDRTIQHAGVVVGMGGWADHVFKGEPVQHYPTPFVSSVVPRNVLANTGACVAVATARFDALGGFDEAFEICGSDVELGIRAHKQGLLNVYLPAARLLHLESKTRSPHVPEVDFQQSALKYAPYRLEGDPFYNPNLDLSASTPRPRVPGGHVPGAQ